MALKWGIVPFLLLLVRIGVDAGAESNVDNVGARDNHDHLQEEILAAMKDSGVLDEWKEKLDDMLYNEIDDSAPVKEKKKLPLINDQEREMLKSFIDEYKTDSNIDVSTDLILSIVERVQKTPKPNLPQIFVQLGPVIDIVADIAKKTKDVQKIIDRQAPIFDSPAKPKDILHTLAENLKSELNRLRPQQNQNKQKPKASAEGLGLSDYLTLGSTLLKGGNGAELMSLLTGDADMSSIIKLLPQLIEGGEYKSLLGKMFNSYLSSSPLGSMISMYLGNVLDSEEGKLAINRFYEILEEFVKSKSYQRLTTIIPQLMAAKDSEQILMILTKEAESNWDLFFASITNEDLKENFLDSLASYAVQSYDWFENIPVDGMLSQAPLLINGFLMSQKLPSYNSKKPAESIKKIVVKLWKKFGSPVKDLDIADIFDKSIETSTNFLKQLDSEEVDFDKLSTKEKEAFVSRTVDHHIVSPVQSVWTVYSTSQSKPQCSEHLLCLINMREAQQSSTLRQAVVRGGGLVVGWTLGRGSKEKYWRMYKSVWSGVRGDDCSVHFPVSGKDCDVFSWQTKQIMNTQYDHIEL